MEDCDGAIEVFLVGRHEIVRLKGLGWNPRPVVVNCYVPNVVITCKETDDTIHITLSAA